MALAVTQSFAQLVIELETTTPGTYTTICGMKSGKVSRKAQSESSEVPDCADETVPFATFKEVMSLEVSVSGEGVWAQSSHNAMMTWYYSGLPRNIRIRHLNAAIGDIQTEAGPALLMTLDDDKSKGKVIAREIQIDFVGTPTRTNRVS